jgi:D-aminoacyl-tRNA deacylase
MHRPTLAGVPAGPRLVVLSETDPVARRVAELWGPLESTGTHVDGAPVRHHGGRTLVLRRPGPHLRDERLDLRLPATLRELRPTLVFPSVHRSERGDRCLTVHPLGNPGARADLGGRPRTLVPTDPREMAAVLRALDERGNALGVPATLEATHHGPEVGLPAFFVEVSVDGDTPPTDDEIRAVSEAILAAAPEPEDRIALAVGGGHYAPRFTDLVKARRWAFGHILSRYALEDLDGPTARAALDGTPGAEGLLFARALDRTHPALGGLGPVLAETDAPRRAERERTPTSRIPRTSGT